MWRKMFIFMGLFGAMLANIFAQELELLPAVAFLYQDISATPIPIWAIHGRTCEINYMIRGGISPYKVKWDFGDGTPPEIKDYPDRKFINIQHTYNLPLGRYRNQHILNVYATDAQNRIAISKRHVTVLQQEDWNEGLDLQRMMIISKAMWYVHTNLQDKKIQNDVSINALFLQLLVNCGHNPFESAKEDGYIEDAKAAIRVLESSLSKFRTLIIKSDFQPGNDGLEFDCNGNGRLICVQGGLSIDTIHSIVLMVLSSVLMNLSNDARAKATLTFDGKAESLDLISQDMAELILAAQNLERGWGIKNTDRSAASCLSRAQWAVIALYAWEHSQKAISANMKHKLAQSKKWLLDLMPSLIDPVTRDIQHIDFSTRDIRCTVTEADWIGNAVPTATGLCCAAWTGIHYNDPMVLGFREFIYNHWESLTCYDISDLRADNYYAIMMGLRSYEMVAPNRIEGGRLRNAAGAFIDWHDAFTRKLAQCQTPNGDWENYHSKEIRWRSLINTILFALCLSPRIYEPAPIPIIKTIPEEDLPLNVIFDHSESLSGDSQIKIETYSWDFDGDSHPDKELTNPFEQPQWTYSKPGTYQVTLTTRLIKNNRLLEGKAKKKITVQANPNHAGRFLPPPMFIGPFAQKTKGQIALIKLNREIYPNKTWDDNIIVTLGDISNSQLPIQILAEKANYLAIALPDSLESHFTINWSTQNNTLTPCLLKTYLRPRSSYWPRNFQGKPFILLTNVPYEGLDPEEEIKLKGTLFLILDQPGDNKWEANLDFKGIGDRLFALADKPLGNPQTLKSIGIKGAKLALFDPKAILISSPIKASADIPIEWVYGDRNENQLYLLRKIVFRELEKIE